LVKIKQNLKVAHDRQKSYANKGRIPREFKIGEHVSLKAKPNPSSLKLGSFTKIAARHFGLFEILDKIGHVAYMLALPTTIKLIMCFHVSLLKMYVHDPKHVIDCGLI